MVFGAVDKRWTLDEIKEIYNSIEIQQNEEGVPELGFNNLKMAEKFVYNMSYLSSQYICNKTKFTMQFLSDIMKKMNEKHLIKIEDLYKLSEADIIDKIENSEYKEIFEIWKNAKEIKESDEMLDNKYMVSVKCKIRYINPLVKQKERYIRIDKLSSQAKANIDKALNYKTKKYAYLDLNF